MKSYNIGYKAIEGRTLRIEESETQFDIDEKQPFENSFYDLWDLIQVFIKENHLHNFKIKYICEAPYDGGEG